MAGETTTDKKIRVYLESKIAGQRELKKFSEGFQNLSNNIKGGENIFRKLDKYAGEAFRNTNKGKFLDKFTKELGVNQQQVSKIMSTQGLHFDEFGKVVDMAGRKVENIAKVMGEGYKKAKPFRFEFLSVMFAGMALNRVFGNLNKTAIEWTGINEIMSMTAGDLMLPAMLDLLDLAILPLSDAFMSMPDSVKEVIGWMSLLGEGAGTAVSTIGQIGLAAMGFEKLGLDAKISTAFTSLKTGKSGTSLGKFLGNNIVRGIAGVIGGYFIIKDLFFDEEGSFELGNKIGAGVAMGIAAKNPVIGAAVAAGLTAAEHFIDPEGAGYFATKLVNAIWNAINGTADFLANIRKYIWNKILGRDDEVKNIEKDMSSWLDKYAKGVKRAADELQEAGKLNENVALKLGGDYARPVIDKYNRQNIPETFNLPFLVLGQTLLGEEIIPKQNNNSSPIINTTYNVSVSDKREFEAMLEKNNRQLTMDVRRYIY